MLKLPPARARSAAGAPRHTLTRPQVASIRRLIDDEVDASAAQRRELAEHVAACVVLAARTVPRAMQDALSQPTQWDALEAVQRAARALRVAIARLDGRNLEALCVELGGRVQDAARHRPAAGQIAAGLLALVDARAGDLPPDAACLLLPDALAPWSAAALAEVEAAAAALLACRPRRGAHRRDHLKRALVLWIAKSFHRIVGAPRARRDADFCRLVRRLHELHREIPSLPASPINVKVVTAALRDHYERHFVARAQESIKPAD